MTKTETVEVQVPVDTPLPEDCFARHSVPGLDTGEPLTFRRYDDWVEEVGDALAAYMNQAARCRDLNQRRVSH